jgi:hypothetical protein
MNPAAALVLCLLSGATVLAGCQPETAPTHTGYVLQPSEEAFIEDLEERSFRFFWDLTDSATGLCPDRAPQESFSSVAATGFALTAYPIGVERGYITRSEARQRVETTLRFLFEAPQDSSRSGATGYHGFFYHFLAPKTGHRFAEVELSTVDTALLVAGALFCQTYFDQPDEVAVAALADSIYARVDWQWASVRPPTIGHGYTPENGHLPYDWRGYNEAMLLYVLALGSPTHPVDEQAWSAWTSGYRWGEFQGQSYLGFSPMFGHQYAHTWIDFRGIQDAFMREKGIDYFENSRRATYAQRSYAIENPDGWKGYGPELWGLSACDGPLEGRFEVGGEPRQFHTYWARGACFTGVFDDGTIAPTAAGASIAFAPEIVLPTLISMQKAYGERVYSTYGFLDAMNPTFDFTNVDVQHGQVDADLGWFDTDYLGIDVGPVLAMAENLRSELVWSTMRRNPHIVRGLRAAGFTGGWLDVVTSSH